MSSIVSNFLYKQIFTNKVSLLSLSLNHGCLATKYLIHLAHNHNSHLFIVQTSDLLRPSYLSPLSLSSHSGFVSTGLVLLIFVASICLCQFVCLSVSAWVCILILFCATHSVIIVFFCCLNVLYYILKKTTLQHHFNCQILEAWTLLIGTGMYVHTLSGI